MKHEYLHLIEISNQPGQANFSANLLPINLKIFLVFYPILLLLLMRVQFLSYQLREFLIQFSLQNIHFVNFSITVSVSIDNLILFNSIDLKQSFDQYQNLFFIMVFKEQHCLRFYIFLIKNQTLQFEKIFLLLQLYKQKE